MESDIWSDVDDILWSEVLDVGEVNGDELTSYIELQTSARWTTPNNWLMAAFSRQTQQPDAFAAVTPADCAKWTAQDWADWVNTVSQHSPATMSAVRTLDAPTGEFKLNDLPIVYGTKDEPLFIGAQNRLCTSSGWVMRNDPWGYYEAVGEKLDLPADSLGQGSGRLKFDLMQVHSSFLPFAAEADDNDLEPASPCETSALKKSARESRRERKERVARSGSVWIIGHGGDVGTKTFAPDGMKVHFYVAGHKVLTSTQALGIASLMGADGVETFTGTSDLAKSELPNYQLACQKSDWDVARFVQAAADENAQLSFIELDDDRLCTTPNRCRKLGEHNCRGVLGRFRNYEHLHMVSCRSASSDAKERGETVPTVEEKVSRARELSHQIISQPTDDLKMAFLESLEPDIQAMVLSYSKRLYRFSLRFNARKHIERDGFISFAVHFGRIQKASDKVLLLGDKTVKESIRAAHDFVTAFLNDTRESRATKWAQLTPAEQEWMKDQSPRIKKWAQKYV